MHLKVFAFPMRRRQLSFTARRTAELRPRIEEVAAGLLDAVPATEPVDLLATYAVPLPMAVICELLGGPDTDRDAYTDAGSDTHAHAYTGSVSGAGCRCFGEHAARKGAQEQFCCFRRSDC